MCRKLLVPVNYIYICCIWIDGIQAKYVMVGSSLLLLFWESSSRLKFWRNAILNQRESSRWAQNFSCSKNSIENNILSHVSCLSIKFWGRFLVADRSGDEEGDLALKQRKTSITRFTQVFISGKWRMLSRSFFAVAVPIVCWFSVVKYGELSKMVLGAFRFGC